MLLLPPTHSKSSRPCRGPRTPTARPSALASPGKTVCQAWKKTVGHVSTSGCQASKALSTLFLRPRSRMAMRKHDLRARPGKRAISRWQAAKLQDRTNLTRAPIARPPTPVSCVTVEYENTKRNKVLALSFWTRLRNSTVKAALAHQQDPSCQSLDGNSHTSGKVNPNLAGKKSHIR